MERERTAFRPLETEVLVQLKLRSVDKRAAAFLRNEEIPLDDRFEVASRILCPGPATARTLH